MCTGIKDFTKRRLKMHLIDGENRQKYKATKDDHIVSWDLQVCYLHFDGIS